jgi:polyketide biosynthesis enoyl-CoA hydratase PksI
VRTAPVMQEEVTPGVVQLTLCDTASGNTFTAELVTGLIEAFSAIESNPRVKVVVLTGYGNYFASGATRETLLLLQAGKTKFTYGNLHLLQLDCKVPVIAAMQGHAIGAGFLFGLLSDCALLSRESVYAANFMKYGFTPGMGATFIVERKLGAGLAAEMLFSARNYRGAELERRGCPFPVMPRTEVLASAHELARQIADKPMLAIVALKRHMALSVRADICRAVEAELAMQERTFCQQEVRERINALYDE